MEVDIWSNPIHPFIVHFPIAAWTLGTIMLIASLAFKKSEWNTPAWLLLGIGAVTALVASVTGQNDLQALAPQTHDVLERHRDGGNLLPWLMGLLVVFKVHTILSKKNQRPPEVLFCFLSLIITVGLMYVGMLGGALVHQLGLTLGKKK